MSYLKNSLDELVERLGRDRDLGNASFEPIFYLVYPPREILEVKRETPALTARLQNQGWHVHRFSMASAILELTKTAPLRDLWIEADRRAPLSWSKSNKSVENLLVSGLLAQRLEVFLEKASHQKRAVVLVTDLEALHPYLRIGAIENQLYGKFTIPTVFLYPGERTGKTRLKFLGFYPEDGNYRSVHIGG